MDSKQLLIEALGLSVEERAALAGELIDSLDSEGMQTPRQRGQSKFTPV